MLQQFINLFTPLILLITYFITGEEALLTEALSSLPSETQVLGEQTQTTAFVTRIIDGDTIEIATGEKVRFIGIDTPETDHDCYSLEAQLKTTELVLGRQVNLEKDVSETDRYGRLLRYIWLDDILVNQVLVEEGYAYAKAYPPDTRYQSELSQAEITAHINYVGLWRYCQN